MLYQEDMACQITERISKNNIYICKYLFYRICQREREREREF